MPTFKVVVDIEEDGKRVPGFPVTKRVSADESTGRFQVERADSAGAEALPFSELTTASVLFFQSDQALAVALSSLGINAGGLVVVFDGSIAPANATTTNTSGSTANVKGLAAGT